MCRTSTMRSWHRTGYGLGRRRGSITIATTPGPVSFGTKFENFGTLRLRAGYNFDRLLLYFTGGQTYSTVEASYSAPGIAGSVTATRSGFISQTGVVGCGLEYALSNNISVKAEYLYDFTGARFDIFSQGATTIGFGNRSMYHIARFGVNYKFDWLSPSTPGGCKILKSAQRAVGTDQIGRGVGGLQNP